MKMAGNNILTRKQSEKMANEQLIDFAIKLPDNVISMTIKSFEKNVMLLKSNSTI